MDGTVPASLGGVLGRLHQSMYGVAYKLSDGTIGLLFNDDTKMSYMTSDRDSPIVYSAARDSNNSIRRWRTPSWTPIEREKWVGISVE